MDEIITKLNNNLTDLFKQCSPGNQNARKSDLSILIEGNNKKIAELFAPITPESDIDPKLLPILKLVLSDANKKNELLYKELKERYESDREEYRTEFFNMKQKIDALDKDKSALLKRAQTAEKEVRELKQEIETSRANIDDLEQGKRNSCIVVNNLATNTASNDEDAFIKLCTDKIRLDATQIEIVKKNIVKVNRIKEPQSNRQGNRLPSSKPRPLLVKFDNERVKDLIFRKKRALKETGIVITEFLTPMRSALLKQCIDKIPGGKSIWTDTGWILVKLQGKTDIDHIANELDLNNFLEKNIPTMPTNV